MTTDEVKKEIAILEVQMADVNFWQDKSKAQETVRLYNELKDKLAGGGKYDRGDAVVTIFGGAGGTDAEDFALMLFNMYMKFISKRGWSFLVLHKNENDHGGFRNITFEVGGKNVYGDLKKESGVHRLVRISPFNAKKLRHTSFAMVEVIPKFEEPGEIEIDEKDIKVEFARSSGPGGQNVNKRETAVRIVHTPTGLAVHCESERSQASNREKCLNILRGKIYHQLEEERIKKVEGMYISKTTSAEWGSQIRSYVLHPYKMIKDHRTNMEINNVESVLDEGNLEPFIEAEKKLP